MELCQPRERLSPDMDTEEQVSELLTPQWFLIILLEDARLLWE